MRFILDEANLTSRKPNDVAVAERAVAAEEATGNGSAYQAPRVPAGLPSGAGAGPRKEDSLPAVLPSANMAMAA
jgi:hypothetical protein